MKYEKGHKQSNTGRTHFKKGVKHTNEWKEIMKIKMKGNTNGFIKGFTPWNKRLKGYMAGSKNGNWKGGTTSINEQIRKSIDYKEWAKSVYIRDNFTCQMCGLKCRAKNIIAHHKKSFAEYPELRFEIDNGIALCRSCHKKMHKEIGINTRFQPALAI